MEIHDKFYRSLLDKQLGEKVKMMDKAVQLNDFNFLLTETDHIVVLVERATADNSVSAASVAVVIAEFNYGQAQLETEGRIWDTYVKGFKSITQDSTVSLCMLR